MYSRAYIEITNICNKSCSFCIGHKREPRIMSREEFTLAAKKLSEVTPFLYYHVMGEPLTHPQIGGFIKIASDFGLRSVVTTNGTLLEKRGSELIDAGVYKVNISLHSFEGGEGYENYINSCLDFADRASSSGVLCIMRLWNNGHDEGRNEDILRRMREKFSGGEWKSDARGARIRHKLHFEYGERFAWPSMEAEDTGENVFCYALKDHFAVLCDGTVIPCCLDHDGELSLGNIFTQELNDILGSQRAASIKRGFECGRAPEPLCRRCGYARRFK